MPYTREQLKSWTRFTHNSIALSKKWNFDLIEAVHAMQFNSEPFNIFRSRYVDSKLVHGDVFLYKTSTGRVGASESEKNARRLMKKR